VHQVGHLPEVISRCTVSKIQKPILSCVACHSLL